MSAECSRCGQDLVYPIGEPMVGVCVGCNAEDEAAQLRRERDEAREELGSLSRLYVACRDDYERLWAALEQIRDFDPHDHDGYLDALRMTDIARDALALPRKDRDGS